MATRAEQEHADRQRTGAAARGKTAKAGAKTRRKAGRTSAKATYAREARAANRRASRKSTRKSANRVKADSTFEIREELQKGTPEAKFRRARAKGQRVRGTRG